MTEKNRMPEHIANIPCPNCEHPLLNHSSTGDCFPHCEYHCGLFPFEIIQAALAAMTVERDAALAEVARLNGIEQQRADFFSSVLGHRSLEYFTVQWKRLVEDRDRYKAALAIIDARTKKYFKQARTLSGQDLLIDLLQIGNIARAELMQVEQLSDGTRPVNSREVTK